MNTRTMPAHHQCNPRELTGAQDEGARGDVYLVDPCAELFLPHSSELLVTAPHAAYATARRVRSRHGA